MIAHQGGQSTDLNVPGQSGVDRDLTPIMSLSRLKQLYCNRRHETHAKCKGIRLVSFSEGPADLLVGPREFDPRGVTDFGFKQAMVIGGNKDPMKAMWGRRYSRIASGVMHELRRVFSLRPRPVIK